jgi:uncharacterized protein YdeI (YjbR/CyaY-like superfamily)
MGGDFMVGVSAENRTAAGVAGGDKIKVTLELDTEKRVVEIPLDLQKALKGKPALLKIFEALSNSNKQRYIIPINTAKTEETRQRRIAAVITGLSK